MKKIVLGIALVGLLGAGYFLVKNYQKKGNECCKETAIIEKKEGEVKTETGLKTEKVEAKSEKTDAAKKSEKKVEAKKTVKTPAKKVSPKKEVIK